MSFSSAKNQLTDALNIVFNKDIRIDDNPNENYQDCVLYVNIQEVRALIEENNALSYFVSGYVFLNTDSPCAHNIGDLVSRAKIYNNVKGLYFSQNEIIQGAHISLNFEFISKIKELDMEAIAESAIKDMSDNKITGEY